MYSREHTFRTAWPYTLLTWLAVVFSGCMLFSSCHYYYTDAAYEAHQLRILDVPSDSGAHAIISPYKMALDSQMLAVVGEIAVDMRRSKPESTLGNFICDVVETEAERVTGTAIDFGVYNYGGIRQEFLNKGPVTKGKIYELLPFENFGAIVTLDGPSTGQLINKIVEEGGWPVSHGLRVVVKNGKPAEIYIDDMPYDPAKTYRVVMNDYMANGGDRMPFIKKDQVQVMGVTIRDMMLQHLMRLQQEGKAATSAIEGRIQYAD